MGYLIRNYYYLNENFNTKIYDLALKVEEVKQKHTSYFL